LSKDKIEKLDIRVNKTKKRLKPTLESLSKISLWDRIFNYKSKVNEIVEDYLY
jgi:flagellar biosynthesis protein FlhB